MTPIARSGACFRRTLILLAAAFGAVVAAGIPVAIGALAIAMTMGVVALLARILPMSILVLNVSTMLGLGLGIDYALLLVSRFRESRRSGLTVEGAAIEAATRAGKSVALSGATVLVGFLALLLVPLPDLRSIAIGGALVTTISVLLATTLLPGALVMLGDRVDALARATTRRGRDERGRWLAALERVGRQAAGDRPGPRGAADDRAGVAVALARDAHARGRLAPCVDRVGARTAGSGRDGEKRDRLRHPGHRRAATRCAGGFAGGTTGARRTRGARQGKPARGACDAGRGEPGQTARCARRPTERRERRRRGDDARPRTAAKRRGGAGRSQWRAPRRWWPARIQRGLRRLHRASDPARRCAGRPRNIRRAHDRIPVGADPAQGDRAEPAVRGRRVRRGGAGLPARSRVQVWWACSTRSTESFPWCRCWSSAPCSA